MRKKMPSVCYILLDVCILIYASSFGGCKPGIFGREFGRKGGHFPTLPERPKSRHFTAKSPAKLPDLRLRNELGFSLGNRRRIGRFPCGAKPPDPPVISPAITPRSFWGRAQEMATFFAQPLTKRRDFRAPGATARNYPVRTSFPHQSPRALFGVANFLTARAPGKWPLFWPHPRPKGPVFGPRGRPPGIARFAHHFHTNLDELFLAA